MSASLRITTATKGCHAMRQGDILLRITALSVIVLALVCGCAVTDYKPVIASFADATTKADDAFAAMRTAELTAQLNAHKKRILAGQEIVAISVGDCIADSSRCRLAARDATGASTQLSATEGLENLSNLMHAVSDYASKLTAIVDATTAQSAAANVAAAEGSVVDAATAASKLPGVKIDAASVKAFGDPSASVISWLVGEYVNQMQVAALRQAVTGADPVIQRIAHALSGAASVSFAPSQSLRQTFQASRAAYDDDPKNADKLDRYLQAATALDSYLAAAKSDMFAEMAKAHGALAQQLSGGNLTLAQVERAVQAFAATANALSQVVQQFQKAAAPKQQ
jgi:hypothetical protein